MQSVYGIRDRVDQHADELSWRNARGRTQRTSKMGLGSETLVCVGSLRKGGDGFGFAGDVGEMPKVSRFRGNIFGSSL